MMRHTRARVLAVVAFAGLLSYPATTYTAGPPTQAKYRGLTYGEWMGCERAEERRFVTGYSSAWRCASHRMSMDHGTPWLQMSLVYRGAAVLAVPLARLLGLVIMPALFGG